MSLRDIPQVQITVDLVKAGRLGLKPGAVRRAAGVIFAGQEVSDIHRDDKVYDVMVWSVPEARHSLTASCCSIRPTTVTCAWLT